MEKKKTTDGFTGFLFILSGVCSTIQWGFGGLAIWSGVFAIVVIFAFVASSIMETKS